MLLVAAGAVLFVHVVAAVVAPITSDISGCTLPPNAIDIALQRDPNPAVTSASNLTRSDWDRCHADPARRALAGSTWACRAFQSDPAMWIDNVLPWRVLNERLITSLNGTQPSEIADDYAPLFSQLARPLVAQARTTDDAVRALVGKDGVWSSTFVDTLCTHYQDNPFLHACAALLGKPLQPNASVVQHEATLAPLELLANRGGSASRHGPSFAVYLCSMLRAVGIPARVVSYPQRGTIEALTAATAGAPVLQEERGSKLPTGVAPGFDGKVWIEFWAVEHVGWSFLAAVPGAEINSTDSGALAFESSITGVCPQALILLSSLR